MTTNANDGFYEIKGKANTRQLTIGNVAARCNSAGEKRIMVPVTMVLTGRSNKGAPEWLDEAYTYVGKNHQTVEPGVEFQGYEIKLDAENLFGEKCVVSTKCRMRAFKVFETGSEEKPDVVCTFAIYMPYSKKLWSWLGEYVGEEIWTKFTPIAEDQKPAEESEEEAGEEGETDMFHQG